jgi:hypothetical protein
MSNNVKKLAVLKPDAMRKINGGVQMDENGNGCTGPFIKPGITRLDNSKMAVGPFIISDPYPGPKTKPTAG